MVYLILFIQSFVLSISSSAAVDQRRKPGNSSMLHFRYTSRQSTELMADGDADGMQKEHRLCHTQTISVTTR